MIKKLNPFIADEIATWNTNAPDIDVLLTEHYGQKAEDLIVEALLRAAVKSGALHWHQCQFIEIGGNHPFATSASYLLQKKYGLSGDIYEANTALIDELVRVRTSARIFNEAVCPPHLIANGKTKFYISSHSELSSLSADFIKDWRGFATEIVDVKEVPAITLDQAFERGTKSIALLAIDIEGLDLQIIEGSDITKYRPYIVQIEPSNHFIKDNDHQMITYFHKIDYELVAMTDVNLIFRDASTQPRREPLNLMTRIFENFVRRRV